jgi:hypothetical protein
MYVLESTRSKATARAMGGAAAIHIAVGWG